VRKIRRRLAALDYDPYATDEEVCEHMIRELLPDAADDFRPSIVLGDSRAPETNAVRHGKAFVFLAGLPLLPLRPSTAFDIVNVDFVADAIVTAPKPNPQHEFIIFPLEPCRKPFANSRTHCRSRKKSKPLYLPRLGGVSLRPSSD